MNNDRPPQEKVCGYEYTVRRGDSFYTIANRLGVPLRDLLEANSDINPARLMVGDVLCIPMEVDDNPPQGLPEQPEQPPVAPAPPAAPETPEEPPEEELPGDEDLDAPAVDNATCPGGSSYTLSEGETAADVQLRSNINRYALQQANPNADLDSLRTGQVLCVPSTNSACPAASTYTLQPEDTLESVALRLNVSLSALLRANPCLAPSEFVPGMCITVPQ